MKSDNITKSEAEFILRILKEQKYRLEKHLESNDECANILFMLEKNEVRKIDTIIEKLVNAYGIK